MKKNFKKEKLVHYLEIRFSIFFNIELLRRIFGNYK